MAVLDGTERADDIKQLAVDIFSYFGLGCRNVSKMYIPEDYCFDVFFENIQHCQYLLFQKTFLFVFEQRQSESPS